MSDLVLDTTQEAQETSNPQSNAGFDVRGIVEEQNRIDQMARNAIADGDPNRAVEINRLSRHFNQSQFAIHNRFDQRIQQYKKDIAGQTLSEAPSFSEWAGQNNRLAPALKDDIKTLTEVEKLYAIHKAKQEANLAYRTPEELEEGEAFEIDTTEGVDLEELTKHEQMQQASFAASVIGEKENRLGQMWNQARLGLIRMDSPFLEESERLEKFISEGTERFEDSVMFAPSKVLGQMTDMFSSFRTEMAEGAAKASAFGAVGLGAASVAGVTGAAAFSPLVAMAGAGAIYNSTRALEAGLSFKELVESGVSIDKARTISALTGTVNGLIEATGDMVLGGVIGGAVKGTILKGISYKVAKALQEKSALNAVANVALGYAGGISTEVATEVLQEVVGISGEEIGRIWSGTGKEGITLDEAQDRLVDIAVQTFKAAAVLGGIGAVPVITHQVRLVKEANERRDQFLALAEQMKNVQAVQSAPEVVADAVQHMANNAETPTVFIDGTAFAQTMQEAGITAEELQQTLPEVASQLEQAQKTGGDVKIPMGDYAAKIAPTDMGEALAQHVRVDEEALSSYEAQQVQAAYKGLVKDAVKDWKSIKSDIDQMLDDEYGEVAKQIEEDAFGALSQNPSFSRSQARTQARLASLVVSNLARRAKIAPAKVRELAPQILMQGSQQGFNQEPQDAVVKLRKEAEAWRSYVNSLTDKPSEPPVMLTQTPLVMKLVGAEFRKLLIAPHIFDGMFPKAKRKKGHHPHEAMTAQVVKQLAEAIADPVMVFKSATRENSFVFALDVRDNVGDPVIVSVVFEGKGLNLAVINVATSAYGKERSSWFNDQIEAGRLLYVNTEKIKHWTPDRTKSDEVTNASLEDQATSPGPIPFGKLLDQLDDSIKTEEDLRKEKLKYPGYYQLDIPQSSKDAIRDQFKDTDQWMKAPNGKDTNLTEDQWCTVRTPEFKAWFGDWENDPENASKVIDENGEPKVVYHGTRRAGFDTFDTEGHGKTAGTGAFFTDELSTAKSYSGTYDFVERETDPEAIEELESEIKEAYNGANYPVFLNIRKPYYVSGEGKNWNSLNEIIVFDEELSEPIYSKDDGSVFRSEDDAWEYIENELGDPGHERYSVDSDDGAPSSTDDYVRMVREGDDYFDYLEGGEDGVIFENIVDKGRYGGGGESTVYAVFEPEQIKSAELNTGAFDPNDPNILHQTIGIQGAKRIPFSESLVTLHNIREEGLLKADKLGALPVPSLAITKAANDYTQFGEITLVGTQSLADPARNPVFSVDAYTARFPKLDWSKSLNQAKARPLVVEIEKLQSEVGDNGTGPYYALKYQANRDEAYDRLVSSSVGMAMFLKHKGIEFKTVQQKPKSQSWSTPELLTLVKKLKAPNSAFANGNEIHKQISDVMIGYFRELLANDNRPVTFMRKIYQNLIDAYDSTGFLPEEEAYEIFVSANAFIRDQAKYRKKEMPLDERATKEALKKKIKPMQDEYEAYIAQRVNEAFNEPRIRDGEKTQPLTLGNVVRAMTRNPDVKGGEMDAVGMYGFGAIRAGAATRYRSMDRLKADRDRVVSHDESYESEKSVDVLLDAFMQAASPYYKHGGSGYDRSEAVAEMMYKAADNGGSAVAIRSAAKRNFKALPANVVEQGVKALEAARSVMTDYMESKPQRAVYLNEFAGAVVPKTISKEALAVLEKAGVKIATYDPKRQSSRKKATETLEKRLHKERGDILFQSAYHGTPHAFDSFSTEHIGSGLGSQAHGWGLYFAKEKSIARRYQEQLTNRRDEFLYDGQAIDELSGDELLAVKTLSRYGVHPIHGAFEDQVESIITSVEKDTKRFVDRISLYEDAIRLIDETPKLSISKFKAQVNDKGNWILSAVDVATRNAKSRGARASIKDVKEVLLQQQSSTRDYLLEERAPIAALRNLDYSKLSYGMRSGRLFEVDVPESDVLLDEAKRYEEQPPKVKEALEKIVGGFPAHYFDGYVKLENLTGKELYEKLSYALGGDKQASLKLNDYGVKGISYENARDGRCFVVFDDKAVKVLEYYQRENAKINEWRKLYANPDERQHAEYAEQLRSEEPRSYQAEFERQGYSPRDAKISAQHRAVNYARATQETYRKRTGLSRVNGLSIVATWSPSEKLNQIYSLNSIDALDIHELESTPENAQAFADAITKAKQGNKNGAAVYVYPVEEYQQMKLFLTADRKAGIAVKPNGDIVSVFNNKAGRGVAHPLVDVAIENGGNRLDCFDTILPEIYSSHGIRVVTRQKWNNEYAPEGWDKGVFADYNNGEPDVTYMVYDPSYYGVYQGSEGVVESDYDEAVRKQDEAAIALSAPVVFEQANQQPRGSYSPSTNRINLNLNADLSTFSHEIGHWYLENLLQLSKVAGVDPTVTEDANTILKEFGLSSVDEWGALDFESKRKLHERFAYQVEVYLSTGKAPVSSLDKFFARLGLWITDVYRQFKGMTAGQRNAQYRKEFGEDLPDISPELRRVLDRMVAAQDMVKQAEAAESLRPLFDTKPDGMSDEDWEQFLSDQSIAEQEGIAAYHEALAKDEKWYTKAHSKEVRRLQREGQELRAEIREKVEKQIRNKPVYVALDALKSGGKAFGIENLKMAPESLEAFGLNVNQIAKLRNMGCVRQGGLSVSATRQLLEPFARFKNDRQFINLLLHAKPLNEVIEEETTKRCLQKNSVLFNPTKLDELATQALHSKARERIIEHELKYLGASQHLNSRVMREAAKKAAKDFIARQPLGEVRVKRFMALESRASRKAFEAVKNGDRQAAFAAKLQQLFNHECTKIALELEKDSRRMRDLRNKIFKADKELAKSYDMGPIYVARFVLTNHGLGKGSADNFDPSDCLKHIEKIKQYNPESYAAYGEIVSRHGYDPMRGRITEAPTGEVQQMMADLKWLMDQARSNKTISIEGKRLDREQVVDELIAQGESLNLKSHDVGTKEATTKKEKAVTGLCGIAAALRRVESWCNSMDAGNNNHPFRRYIYDPIANAASKYRNANSEMQKKFAELLKEYQPSLTKLSDIEAPELGYTFRSKMELIGAILHTGNQSNKQKLLLGGRGRKKYPWARVIETPDGQKFVDTSAWDNFIARCYREGIITKEDMDFVQGVWDLMESIKPQIQKTFYEVYGYYFEEIEAQEIQTPFGTYRGGYVPAMTDRDLVENRSLQEEATRITETEFMSIMPVSRPGFSQSRVAGYTEPLDLDLSRLCGHIQKTLQFAYIALPAQEVGKILSDKRFVDFTHEYAPKALENLLLPWLKRSYHQRVNDGKEDAISNLLNKYRALAGMAIMAGNVINAAQQITGFSIALNKVKAKSLALSMKRLMSKTRTIEDIMQLSPFMRSRLEDRAFEYQSKLERIAKSSGRLLSQKGAFNKVAVFDEKLDPARDWIASHAYFLQVAVQGLMDPVVWGAAFDEAITQGMTVEEAVAEADSVVRTTQSSFNPEDVADIETGSSFKRAFLVFYNYFGMQLNLMLEKRSEARLQPTIKKYGMFASTFILTVYIPAVVAKMIELALKGEFGGDDEDEWEAIDWLQLFLGEPVKNLFAMVPFAGGVTNSLGAMLAKQGNEVAQLIFGKDPYVGKPMSSPAVDLLENSFKAITDLYRMYDGDEVGMRKITREMLDLLTLISRIPVGVLKKPLGYGAGVLNDETDSGIIEGIISGR